VTDDPQIPQLDIRTFGAALGAEVHGIDVRDAASPGLRRAIREALLAHHILAFPGQHLDDAEHLAFAATLGELYVHPMDRLMGVDEVVIGELDTTNDHDTKTDNWHLDVTYSPSPPAFAVNRCLIAPPAGGDTMWANLHLALEALSAPFRERLVGLTTVHSVGEVLLRMRARTYGEAAREIWKANLCDVHQPIVRRHPETGRDALFCVDTTAPIAGMHPLESDAILGVLKQHCANPNFTCRWRWTPGDVVVWDERCTSHFAVRDPWAGPRSMRRVLVEGEPAIPGGTDLPDGR
jgi:alpha-ketoglutarate-dependent taurine dioxygenase